MRTTTRHLVGRDLIGTVAVVAAMVLLTAAGEVPLLAGVAVLQLVVVLGLLAVLDAPAAVGGFAIGAATAAAADVVVVVDDGEVGGLLGVAALAFIASLAHQLVRSHRSRVTESLADTLVVVVVACSAACLPAVLHAPDGEAIVRVALVAGGVALLVCQLMAPLARDESFVLVVALAAGALVSLGAAGDLEPGRAALVGLAAAAAAGIADTLVAVAAAELTDERRAAARAPVSILLPLAVLGPVALTAARLMEQA